ncbi:hypothetical protein BDV26DRAFT_265650 [Aspergillus bertholletiae]|uniref:Uncharacterized protein n=1 Tax=Aspergillus bertholletiae TaxID=1226010 RepID=A0A5N7B2Y8_9EURO|nr:hypothetical protein BDV26DRAFT_265650 [Aspergillus bertholletiae]
MLVYTGKLNYGSYAQDEIITVIFGGNSATMDEPVVATWQWTENAAGETKANSLHVGSLNGLRNLSNGEREIEFLQNQAEESYYWFRGRVTSSGLILAMYNQADELCIDNITLQRTYPSA